MYQIDFNRPIHIHFIGIGGNQYERSGFYFIRSPFSDFWFRCKGISSDRVDGRKRIKFSTVRALQISKMEQMLSSTQQRFILIILNLQPLFKRASLC